METFTHEEIRTHLQRILRRSSFADSPVLSSFLSFIVNETLEGRSRELKEYTIAISALKKESDFNPQIDSIVRIHAGRLRRALKEYYFEEGGQDEIQILVPKGSYIPAFVRNAASVKAANTETPQPEARLTVTRNSYSHKHALAIFPFEDISENKNHSSFIRGLEICLSTDLTSSQPGRLISLSYTSHIYERTNDIREAGAMLNASFLLAGYVQFDKHLRVHVVLTACDTGAQLWAMTIEKKDVDQLDLFALQEEIASKIIRPVFAAIAKYDHQEVNTALHWEGKLNKGPIAAGQ